MSPFRSWVIVRLEKKDIRKKQNIVRVLRSAAPHLAERIIFYNLGEWAALAGSELHMPVIIPDERHEVQELLKVLRKHFAEEINSTS